VRSLDNLNNEQQEAARNTSLLFMCLPFKHLGLFLNYRKKASYGNLSKPPLKTTRFSVAKGVYSLLLLKQVPTYMWET
jgi:hypothetical protein